MVKSIGNVLVIVCSLIANISSQQHNSCFTPSRQAGSCIPLTSCASLYSLFQKPLLNNEDRILISQSQCGAQNQPFVCCPGSGGAGDGGGNDGSSGTDRLPGPGVCGTQTADKIVGGQATVPGEFPWMALLEYQKPNNIRDFHCGGNLINERYVLTASHCINGRGIPRTWSLVSVRLGEYDTTTEPDCQINEHFENICAPPALDIPIETKIPHELYNKNQKNQENDIGLLRLRRAVQYSDYIKPICLPRSASLKNINYDGLTLWVAGWGKTEYAQQSEKLLKAKINGYNFNRCYDKYSPQGTYIKESQLCAGGQIDVDSCNGDSGGPLMTTDTSTGEHYWYLAGVVSFGPKECGSLDRPGVYTRIASYITWIESKILDSVRLGEWSTLTEPDCEQNEHNETICASDAINIPIEKAIPHESYIPDDKNQINDIGLIKLSKSVQFSDYIKPICLPTSVALKSINYDGLTLTVAGWGRTETERRSEKLLKVKLDGYNTTRCQELYKMQNFELTDSQMCAGINKGMNSCNGDSGGPLMAMDTLTEVHYWYVAGIVSFGPRQCGAENRPTVYTRVDSFIPWIESNIAQLIE